MDTLIWFSLQHHCSGHCGGIRGTIVHSFHYRTHHATYVCGLEILMRTILRGNLLERTRYQAIGNQSVVVFFLLIEICYLILKQMIFVAKFDQILTFENYVQYYHRYFLIIKLLTFIAVLHSWHFIIATSIFYQ